MEETKSLIIDIKLDLSYVLDCLKIIERKKQSDLMEQSLREYKNFLNKNMETGDYEMGQESTISIIHLTA